MSEDANPASFETLLAVIKNLIVEDRGEEAARRIHEQLGILSDVECRILIEVCLNAGLCGAAIALVDSIEKKVATDLSDKAVAQWIDEDQTEALKTAKKGLLLEETGRGLYVTALITEDHKLDYKLTPVDRALVIDYFKRATFFDDCPESVFYHLDTLLPRGIEDDSTCPRDVWLQKGIVKFPHSLGLRSRIARLQLFVCNQPALAVAVLEPVSQSWDTEAFWLASQAQRTLGQMQKALSYIDQLPPPQMGHITLNKLRGDVCFDSSDLQRAIEFYNADIAGEVSSGARVIALFSRARTYLSLKEIGKAAIDTRNVAEMCFDLEKIPPLDSSIKFSEDYTEYYQTSEMIEEVCRVFLADVDLSPIKKDSATYGQLAFIFSKMVMPYESSPDPKTGADEYWLNIAKTLHPHPLISKDLRFGDGDPAACLEHHLRYAIWKARMIVANPDPRESVEDFYDLTESSEAKTKLEKFHKLINSQYKLCVDPKIRSLVFAPLFESTWSAILKKLEKYKELVSISSELLNVTSDPSASLLWELAFNSNRIGAFATSETAYRSYLALKPQSPSALHNLSLLAEKKGDLREALQLQERACRLAESDEIISNRYASFNALRTFIQASESNLKKPIPIESLSIRERLYLCTLLICCLPESGGNLIPPAKSNLKLAPTPDLVSNLLQALWNRRIIEIDPFENRESHEVDSEGSRLAHLDRVTWITNVKTEKAMSTAQLIAELVVPSLVNDELLDEAEEIWKELALEESIEYLTYRRLRVGFDNDVADKTREYFADLLGHFSVGQMYNLINRSVEKAVTRQREEGLANRHTSNLISHGCKSYGEHALAQGWQIKPFRRDFKCPQSVISQLFFDRLLLMEDEWFVKRPGDFGGLKSEVGIGQEERADGSENA